MTLTFATMTVMAAGAGQGAHSLAKNPSPPGLKKRLSTGDGQTLQSVPFKYSIAAPPAYVQRHRDPHDQKSSLQASSNDVQLLLLDRQISLLGEKPSDYLRVVLRPLNSQALQSISQLYLGFNPAYQRLILHGIRVHRNGQTFDRTRSVKMDLLRREKNLENNLYEGEVTALGIIPDVRINDVIDYEYSVVGSNPIFGNRYATRFSTNQTYPLDEFHLRLSAPESRKIYFRTPPGMEVAKMTTAGITQYEVTGTKRKAIVEDVNRPAWFDPIERLDIGEYADWKEVKDWADGLFAKQTGLSPQIEEQLALWKKKNLTDQQLIVEVLRWVQGEVRYFGIELGINSHQPAHPNITVARRFGDCKDKSLLLATLLNALGINAQPALVSLQYHRGVANALPSPAVFDHVIVKVLLDGKTYWLDGTRAPQYGTLASLGAYDYGKVLVLGESPGVLQDASYPAGYLERQQTVDRYSVKSFRDPVELVSESIFSGTSAENMRQLLARISHDEMSRIFRSNLQRLLTTATAMGDLETHDDRENNRLTIKARYRIEDFFRYEPGRFLAEFPAVSLLEYLTVPSVPQRSAPFILPYPVQVTHSVVLELPQNPIQNVPDPETLRGTFWGMSSRYQTDKQKVQIDYSLQANKESVPAASIPAFIDETMGLRRKLSSSLTLRVAELTDPDRRSLTRALAEYDRFGDTQSGTVKAEIRARIDSIQITRDIESRKLTDKQLAQAYELRAIAWDNAGNIEASLNDIHQAIELAPSNADYLFTQGTTLLGVNKLTEAMKAFEAAAKLAGADKINSDDYKAMGIALHYLGRDREAAEQLNLGLRAANGGPDLFTAFWQHVVAKRSPDTPSQLEAEINREPGREWPYPIGEMLLGRISPEKLIDAAASTDKGIQRDQLCEAYFYIGQRYRWEGQSERARAAFEKSVAQEIYPFAEYAYALHELGRVKTSRTEKGRF